MNNKARFAFLLALAWLGVAGPQEFAAQLVPLGPETLIYTDNDGYYPNRPSVAAQPDGSYLVSWDDETVTTYDDELPYTYVAAGREPSEQQWSAIGLPEDALGYPSVVAVTVRGSAREALLYSGGTYSESEPILLRTYSNLNHRTPTPEVSTPCILKVTSLPR